MTLIDSVLSVIDWLFSIQTISGAVLPIVIWMISKTIDLIAERRFDRRIIAPVLQEIRWRIQAFRTRLDLLSCTFKMSYTPSKDTSVEEGKHLIEQSIDDSTNRSKKRIESTEISWINTTNARFKLKHLDSERPFKFEVYLVESNRDSITRPEMHSQGRFIDKIAFEVNFEFAYHELSTTLSNLDTIITILKESLDDTIGGTESKGQFVISPITGGLKVDEWIREEGLDVTTRLSGKDSQKTQVEFFNDRAEVNPPYLQIDSEVERYIRIVLLDYYLKKGGS